MFKYNFEQTEPILSSYASARMLNETLLSLLQYSSLINLLYRILDGSNLQPYFTNLITCWGG